MSELRITTIDTRLSDRDHLGAAYLLQCDGRAAFVDCGTALAVPRLLAALDQAGLERDQVDYVIPTHVHLDHAGGAGTLMQALPTARLVIHPYGARHMIDPSKLIGGATAVYGEDAMRAHFGDILPVDAERVSEAEDRQRLTVGGCELCLLDTPGHARHHLCVVAERERAIFTGDTFGLSYRAFDCDGRPFLFPATTPVQFDPDALHRSIDRLVAEQPTHYYLTHYGQIPAGADSAQDLHRRIDGLVAIAEAAGPADDQRLERIRVALNRYLLAELHEHGCSLSDDRVNQLMAMDIELDSQGLEVWLRRREAS